MANDHYISRFLTKPWEGQNRQLHYFNFESQKFGSQTSRHLFAAEGLNERATEELLNKVVETPLAGLLARTIRTDPSVNVLEPADATIFRALATLWLLQVVRGRDASNRGDGFSLDDVLSKGEDFLNQQAQALSESDKLISVTLPESEKLYFPDIAYFPIPIVGARPIAAVPLGPHHLFAFVKKDVSRAVIEEHIAEPGRVTCLSVGIGPNTKVTVIPKEDHHLVENSPEDYMAELIALRRRGPEIINAIGQASLDMGLRGFGVPEAEV